MRRMPAPRASAAVAVVAAVVARMLAVVPTDAVDIFGASLSARVEREERRCPWCGGAKRVEACSRGIEKMQRPIREAGI